MQIISIGYNQNSHWKVERVLKNFLFSFLRKSGRKEYNDGVVALYEFLVFSSAQSRGFTWASKARMTRELVSSQRTTERRLKTLRESGLIKTGSQWIRGKLRRGCYILARQDIVQALREAGIAFQLHTIEDDEKTAPNAAKTAVPAASQVREERQVVRQFVEGGIYKDRTPERTFLYRRVR